MSTKPAHDLDEKERTNDVLTESKINFNALLLSEPTLSGLTKSGFHKPSPIQLKAIPIGKCGFDLVVKSKSGTGKTAVFGIIALEMINVKKNTLQVLILAPTREIAAQICDVIHSIGVDFKGLQTGCFIGGLPMENDIQKLQNCHIAVGAPGRIKHLIDQGHLKTDSIRLFVLDEADKLMESSYKNDINKIYHKIPPRKQMLVLSATYPDDLDIFLTKYMQTPTHISPDVDSPILLGLKQYVSVVKSNLNVIHQTNIKNEELIKLLSKISFTQCLIFSNFQARAESISNTLNRKGWQSTYISAAQTQTERLEAVNSLKNFKCRILLSTDLTARGIDAANVDLVINYDVPHDASTYLHRMGRAGRYGSKGICITMAAKGKELVQFQNIIGMIGGTDLAVAKLPSDETFPINIWESDPKSFEQIFGTIDENCLDEKTAKLKNIKGAILDLKNFKQTEGKYSPDYIEKEDDKKDCTNNDNEAEIIDINKVKEINEDIKSEISANKLISNRGISDNGDLDIKSLLMKMASGEAIDTTQTSKIFDTKNILESLAYAPEKIDTTGILKEIANAQPVDIETHKLVNGNSAPDLQHKLSNEANMEMDTHSILNKLAKCESIEIDVGAESKPFNSEIILKSLAQDVTIKSPDTNKRKRIQKEIKSSTLPKIKQIVSRENILQKNICLYNTTKLLCGDGGFDEIDTDSIHEYIKNIKQEEDLIKEKLMNDYEDISCREILESVKSINSKDNEVEPCLENLFVYGFDYNTKHNKTHWLDIVGEEFDENQKEEQKEVINLLDFYEDEVEMEEELNEEVEFVPETRKSSKRRRRTKKSRTNRENENGFEQTNMQWTTVCNNVTSNQMLENQSHHYGQNETYTSYYDRYSNMLYENSYNFSDVESFDNWFAHWQQQVASVRDYVQQNIYLQEMNYLQYYNGN